tara:strand:+ start:23355 stop:23600 length:246 start_codon:yes stop_codon:yes gene_type:complete
MEITTSGINKTQGRVVQKVIDSLAKFTSSYDANRKKMPKQVALPSQTYQDIMGFYKTRPDKITFKGVLLYDPANPPKLELV